VDRDTYFKLIEIFELLTSCQIDIRKIVALNNLFYSKEGELPNDISLEAFEQEINRFLSDF
jgi:hypothetical protein